MLRLLGYELVTFCFAAGSWQLLSPSCPLTPLKASFAGLTFDSKNDSLAVVMANHF